MRKELSLLLLAVFLCLIFRLGSWGVAETSEARYSDISRVMNDTGDLLHPVLLHVRHYHKPPLTYIITGFGYKLFGQNSFGTRFFLVIAFLIQIYCVYFIAIRLLKSHERAPLLAAIIYTTIPLIFSAARILTTDTFLTTFVLCAILQWIVYKQDNNRIYLYLFAVFMALGFLTKGPLILLFVLPVMISYSLVFKEQNKKFSIHTILALALFLVVGLSWYVALIRENPEFLNYFLGTQTVDRIATDRFHRGKPIWYFIAFAPLVSLPWIPIWAYLYIPKVRTWKFKRNLSWIFGFSLALPLIVLSLSTSKLILYILPMFGLFSVWLSKLIVEASSKQQRVIKQLGFLFYAFIALGLSIAPFLPIPDIHIPKFISLVGVILGLLLYYFYNRAAWEAVSQLAYSGLLSMLVLIVFSTYYYSENEIEIKSTLPIANFLKEHNLGDKKILVYNQFLPSLQFNLTKDVYSFNDHNRKLDRESQFQPNEEWKQFYFDGEDLDTERLDQFFDQGTVLISKQDDNFVYQKLVEHYEHVENMGNWEIHY